LAIYIAEMDISVSAFKQSCLEVIRRVEETGRPVALTRRGRVVAQLLPACATPAPRGAAPWERVRATQRAVCHFGAGESVLADDEFEAAR